MNWCIMWSDCQGATGRHPSTASKSEQSVLWVQQQSDLFPKPSNKSPADRLSEQMIPDFSSSSAGLQYDKCITRVAGGGEGLGGEGDSCHSRPLRPRKSAVKFGCGQSDRWHRGAVSVMPFPSVTPPLRPHTAPLHLTLTGGARASQEREWRLAQSSVNTLRSHHLQQGECGRGGSVTCVKRGPLFLLTASWLRSAGACYDTPPTPTRPPRPHFTPNSHPDLSEGVTRCWVT